MNDYNEYSIFITGDFAELEALVESSVKERNKLKRDTFAERYSSSKSLGDCDAANTPTSYGAVGMLEEAVECIGDRAAERDSEKERSMAGTIRAFNGIYGTELTEEQGWMFMVFLKAARANGGDFRRDDYVDGAAYFALAGECRSDD